VSAGFAQQIEDQQAEAELMRTNYNQLQQKLKETEARCELLIMQSHRGRAIARAHKAGNTSAHDATRSMQRMRMKI
jgi:phage shock protein A